MLVLTTINRLSTGTFNGLAFPRPRLGRVAISLPAAATDEITGTRNGGDAVYQNIYSSSSTMAITSLVLSGYHILKMDYSD